MISKLNKIKSGIENICKRLKKHESLKNVSNYLNKFAVQKIEESIKEIEKLKTSEVSETQISDDMKQIAESFTVALSSIEKILNEMLKKQQDIEVEQDRIVEEDGLLAAMSYLNKQPNIDGKIEKITDIKKSCEELKIELKSLISEDKNKTLNERVEELNRQSCKFCKEIIKSNNLYANLSGIMKKLIEKAKDMKTLTELLLKSAGKGHRVGFSVLRELDDMIASKVDEVSAEAKKIGKDIFCHEKSNVWVLRDVKQSTSMSETQTLLFKGTNKEVTKFFMENY